jgi:hypothetical protein
MERDIEPFVLLTVFCPEPDDGIHQNRYEPGSNEAVADYGDYSHQLVPNLSEIAEKRSVDSTDRGLGKHTNEQGTDNTADKVDTDDVQ